jgi:N-acyl homoserine lactone hydrolase
LEAARGPDYTVPDLVDAPGLSYELLDGEAEILRNVFVIPTPGHTAGHQSVAVRRGDGTVIIAGQSHDSATDFGRDLLAARAARDRHAVDLPPVPDWISRLQAFDPRRVVFAHDGAVWEP